MHVTQGSISAIMDDSKRHKLNKFMHDMEHKEFRREAWMQIDKDNSAWVTTFPKEHSAFTTRQFPVVAQTYTLASHNNAWKGS